jgi:predicted RNA-binding Zn-ribbon protein involved in translation (DUF1610 family)
MKPIKFFIQSAGTILLMAALIRFVIAAGSHSALAMPEPMLGLPIRYAVLLVGGFELTVALICLLGQRPGLQLSWLAWASTNYLVYWIGLYIMHCHPQTAGIGSLTDPLRLAHGIIGMIARFLPAYIALGSYAALLWLCIIEPMLGRRRQSLSESLKMSCPSCGIHIRFKVKNLGQKIPCPQCQTNIALRRPDLLKMACFFCKEHIKFPPHAIGEKIACPHCNMDITLKELA